MIPCTVLRDKERGWIIGFRESRCIVALLDGRIKTFDFELVSAHVERHAHVVDFPAASPSMVAAGKKPTSPVTHVYVAAPYTKGDVAINVRSAVRAATALRDAGYAVFLPHVTHLWHLIDPAPYETWLKLDFAWVRRCDALVRLPGESPGADREVELALTEGLVVAILLPGEDPVAGLKKAISERFSK